MRKEFYLAVSERLMHSYRLSDGSIQQIYKEEDVPEEAEHIIQHADLWNNNVEYIEQETNWPRPAVFVEFRPILWERMTTRGANGYQARAEVRLHIVTDWKGGASSEYSNEMRLQSIEDLDLSEQIHTVMLGLHGDHFGDVEIQATLTNHNHEQLIENVEVYNVTFVRSIEKKTQRIRVPMDAKLVLPGGQETEVVGPEIP